MNSHPSSGPSLLSVYASGIKRWLTTSGRENMPLIVLVTTFVACVLLLVALDKLFASSGLAYRIGDEIVVAILAGTTVGLFYELVARKAMTQETVSVVKRELSQELETLRAGGMGTAELGLVGFGDSRQYVHQDLANHLSSVRSVRAMVIHGTRLWSNRELERAVLDSAAVEARVMLLDPASEFVRSRADEYPDAYDQEVMRGQISSASALLGTWRKRTGGSCQVKLYDDPPSFWLLIVDDVLYLSGYHRGQVSQDSDVFKFDDRRHSPYHAFSEYFERCWLRADELSH